MTEVPNTILWIAAISLMVLTFLTAILLIMLLVLFGQVKKLVSKMHDIADPLKVAAESAGNTVSTFSNSMLRPLATVMGAMAGFRKGASKFSSGGRRRR